MNRLVKHDLVRGLKDIVFEKDKLCSSCQAGKQVGNTHSKKSMMSTRSGEVKRRPKGRTRRSVGPRVGRGGARGLRVGRGGVLP